MKTNPNESAFVVDYLTQPEHIERGCAGLTKREYFAAMAMQGLCLGGAWEKSIHKQSEAIGSNSSEAIAVYAVDLADALIEALNKEEKA